MPRKKIKRKTAKRKKYVKQSVLDKTIPVRVLVKYLAIVLIFLVIFGAAFALGRMTKKTPTKAKDTVDKTEEPQQESAKEEVQLEPAQETKEPEKTDEIKEQPEKNTDDTNAYGPEQTFDEPKYKNAEFGYEYKNVEVKVSDIKKEDRGNNWASIESLKLTVTNSEYNTIINPTRLKIKLNAVGKGSIWWDDEVFLPSTFKGIKPGQSVSEVIPVHVSFSDIYNEKDLKVVVLDDFDMPIKYYEDKLVIQ